jgi:uncharacterized protein (DUF2062 family)
MSVFGRREKLTRFQRLRRLAWPRMGFRRLGKYYTFRIKRLPGTPYSIACGFACGAAVSFTPFIGFHFIFGAVLAWALRGNVFASAIGTAVGNPWTFPFIWAGVYWLGTTILGYERGQELPAELTIGVIFEQPVAILLPMVVGGLPAGVLVWLIFFLPIRRVVANYQHHRRLKRIKRRQFLDQAEKEKAEKSNEAEAEAAQPDQQMDIPEPAEPRAAAQGGGNVTQLHPRR